jgi:dephospho-CoA kinase
LKNLRKLQKPIKIKKKLSHYVIKNNFNLLSLKNNVKLLKNRILNERNNT